MITRKYILTYADRPNSSPVGIKVGCSITGKQWMYIGHLDPNTKDEHGVGIEIWEDGQVYQGHWDSGNRNGHGRYIWGPDGHYYIGEWKDGMEHGQGEENFSEGGEYNDIQHLIYN